MAYLVNDNCIKCKFTDCVEVCPVDCFYEGENMLVINPNECIDCGVCEPECPADAIITDNVDGANKWYHINEDLSAKWPNITVKKDPLPNADEMILEPNKFERFFNENPGSDNEDSKT